MMAKPMKAFELHYLMIQFLVIRIMDKFLFSLRQNLENREICCIEILASDCSLE